MPYHCFSLGFSPLLFPHGQRPKGSLTASEHVSSLMLRNEVRWPKGKAMTRCYKDFVAPKFTKNLFFLRQYQNLCGFS